MNSLGTCEVKGSFPVPVVCTFDTTVYMGGGVGGSGYDGVLCFRADLLCCNMQTHNH